MVRLSRVRVLGFRVHVCRQAGSEGGLVRDPGGVDGFGLA